MIFKIDSTKFNLIRKRAIISVLKFEIPSILFTLLIFYFLRGGQENLKFFILISLSFIPLMILAGIFIDQKKESWPIFMLRSGFVLVFSILFFLVVLVQKYPGNFGSQQQNNLGEYCPTLDLSGWKDFSEAFKIVAARDQSGHIMGKAPFIIVGKWFPAGHLEFYTARLTSIPLIGIGPLQDIHKFAWLNEIRPALAIGNDAYCIVPSNLPFNVAKAYGSYFKNIDPPVVIEQKRNGVVVRHFAVYRMHGCIKLPVNALKQLP